MGTPSRPGFILVAACAALLMLAPAAIAPAGEHERLSLDGMMFVGGLEITHTGVVLAERIRFSAGLLHSSASDNFGYTDGPYFARRHHDAVDFEAYTESPAMGWMVWRGRIEHGELRARVTAKEPDEPRSQFTVVAYAVE